MTEANHQQPRSRLTIEVVLNVEPDHFYRQAVEVVRAEDPELVPLLPPVPEGASAAEILDDWLSGEEPGDERARKAQDALLTALESSIVVAVIDHLGDTDAEVGIQLKEAWDDSPEDAPFAELPTTMTARRRSSPIVRARVATGGRRTPRSTEMIASRPTWRPMT